MKGNLYFTGFSCSGCGSTYPQAKLFTCDKCGGVLTAEYDYEALKERLSRKLLERELPLAERFSPLLPLENPSRAVSMGEGGTPLLTCKRLGEKLGVGLLKLKDETRNPTWTFKDRAVSVGVSSAMEMGKTTLITASTGNAGASLSAYSARAGLDCVVLAPQRIDQDKLSQILVYGGRVVRVKGGVDEALSLLKGMHERWGWYPLPTSAAYNPLQVEGAKTIAYELCVQAGWSTPDWVIAPVGGGDCVYSLARGFEEFYSLGLTSQIPSIIGVQAEGCAPLVDAFKRGAERVEAAASPTTIASSIRVAYPPTGDLALRSIRRTKGLAETATDDQMLEAQRLLASNEGIFAEPASASVITALKKLISAGTLDRGDSVVCLITGAGLKQSEVLSRVFKVPRLVEATTDGVAKVLGLAS